MPIKGMTQAEIDAATAKVVAAGGKSVGANIDRRLPGETRQEANERITQAYKNQPKPELTQEGKAADAKMKFVRSEAGGVGTFKEIFPIGTPIPATRTTEYGNVYDSKGNLVSGTGLKTGVPGSATAGKTPDQIAAYNSAKDLAQSFVDSYGGKLNDYFNPVTGKVTSPSKDVITKSLNTKKTTEVPLDADDSDTDVVTSSTDKTLVSTEIDDATGDTVGYFSDGSKQVLNKGTGPAQSAEFKDAYALLNQTFRDYGLESLVPAIEGFMKRNLGPNQAAIELRTMPEYIARFKGNDLRRASGKNSLSEAEYLAVEDAYDQTLRAYGQQNYFGIDRKGKQEKAAELIGNDISAVEFKDRIQLAVDRVQNADPTTKATLKQFYPTLNENDLIGYFLNPKDNLPKLKEKVTASEIGAAATSLNLATDVISATDLAKYGVTQAEAREGYSTVAGVLPGTAKLGDIYGESGIKYAQKEAEAEVFKGSQDAATKRKRLASMERASFGGSTGTGQGLGKTSAGLF